MTAPDDFDIGPLTWVKGEIEQALARAGEAITTFAGNPLDSAQLKFCKTHLHQAHGALEIVGLEGVTRLTEECERLLDAVEAGTVPMRPQIAETLVAAFKALGRYLDHLVEGGPHQPVRLFPVYRDVMAVRGADRILESDLFFPDLSPRPPRRESPEVPADMLAYVAGQRRRFQSGLLRWLRNAADNGALREMTEAVRAIERTQAMAQHRAFWWVTIGFTETLVAVGAQAGLEAKRLCARIDLQMKRLMEGSQNVAERLLRDTLYFVARSRVQSPQVQEIRRIYALERAIPADEGVRPDIGKDEAQVAALRETIGAAKDKWNRFSSGQAHELAGFQEQAERLRDAGSRLDNPDFSLLSSAIASVAAWVVANPAKVSEGMALDIATALLVGENAVDNFARPSPEFPQQVMAIGARLKARLAGERPDVPPPVLDDVSRKAEERLVMAQVVSEIRSNLSAIESVLDGFFRDAARRTELPGLEAQLRQVSGALSILGADRAVEALGECRSEIVRFSSPDYAADPADFEKVARSMSALGFFVDALQYGPADFDTFLNPVAPRRARPVEEETTQLAAAPSEVDLLLDGESSDMAPMASVEDELAAQRRDARTLFEAWRDKPDDTVLAAELKANLEAIAQDADLVDERGLQQSAGRALELLDQGSAPALADIEQAMAEVAPDASGEALPAPSDEVRALAQSSDEVVDAELLAIFLEEAREVLGTIGEKHALVTLEPTNQDLLTIIRRGFHTLKGSGRMVGLTRLGEAAWAAEQVMNQWLQEGRHATADLLAMIGAAHALFDGWITDLSRDGVSRADGAPLIGACERMRAGEAFVLPQPVASGLSPAMTDADASREHSVIIGDMRMSPSLYGIFVEEAANHLGVMRREVALLREEPQPPRDELVRSAHTLAGIAGTVSFRRLHELARAFERALLVARSAGLVPEPDALHLLETVIEGIDGLVGAVRELREPAPVGPLEEGLEALRAQWLASSGESDASVFHIASPEVDDEPDDAVVTAPFAPVSTDIDAIAQPPAVVEPAAPTPAADALTAVDFDFSSNDDRDADALPAIDVDMRLEADLPTEADLPLDFDVSPGVDMLLDIDSDAPAEVQQATREVPDTSALPDSQVPFPADAAPAVEIDLPLGSVDEAALPVADEATLSPVLQGAEIDWPLPEDAASAGDVVEAGEVDFAFGDDDPEASLPAVLAEVPTEQSAATDAQHADMDMQHAAMGVQHAAMGVRPAATDLQPEATDLQLAEIDTQRSATDAQQSPVDVHPADVQPVTEHLPPEPPLAEGAAPAVAAEPEVPYTATAIAVGAAAIGAMAGLVAQQGVPAAEGPAQDAGQAPAMEEAPALVAAAGSPAEGLAPTPAMESPPAAPESDALSAAELRARGFDPSERLLERIQDEIDPQLLPIFLEEAAELVPLLDQQLRTWSATPGDAGNSQGLQRTLHTLKGSARMAGAMAIGQVTHSMETRVENALEAQSIPASIFEGLIASCDRINALLDNLRAGADGAVEAPLELAPEAAASALPAEVASPVPDLAAPAPPLLAVSAPPAVDTPPRARQPQPAAAAPVAQEGQRTLLRVRSDLIDRLVNEAGEVAIARSRIEGEMRGLKAGLKELTESVGRLRNQLREIEIAAESQMQSRQREAEERHESFDPLEFDRFTRFQEITRMMAESVNDVATVQQSLLKSVDDADLAILSQARLNRDLQGDLMRVRMVPFNNVAERLYRVVRQTAKELGKRANLDISGLQTEIDRSVLERMTGPFEHLLRNAIAHGIEAPEAREAAGKNAIGQIMLTARQEGNEFFLVFEDDGRGLNLEKIRARAVEAGLARAGDSLTDQQIAEFIFMPGFSTADSVSEVAGRGVGMDVVRAEVAALGGRIDTEFTPGRGTRFSIALPLTLAVTQVVLVRVGSSVFAIPSVMVEQVRQTRSEDLVTAYESQSVQWQDRDYPLFYLPRLLGDPATRAQSQRFTPVLLVRSGTQRAAIHVDELVGNQEVVVKNIGPQLARVTGIAGATVLGNGQIVLILNPVPLALQVLAGGVAQPGPEGEAGGEAEAPAPAAVPTVMVVDDSLTVRKITSRLLLRENYQVLTARDGVDALEQLQTARPDILLVDIEMPRMDGFDLTRNVRADAALRHIPIIMITSRTADKHRKYALEVGVNLFLGKPYQEEELLDGIAALLRHADSTV